MLDLWHKQESPLLCVLVLPCTVHSCRPIPRWWPRHPTRGTSAASESLNASHAAGAGWVETAGPTTVSEHCHGNQIFRGWSWSKTIKVEALVPHLVARINYSLNSGDHCRASLSESLNMHVALPQREKCCKIKKPFCVWNQARMCGKLTPTRMGCSPPASRRFSEM